MERPTPTDPPDEPVNRIAVFLEQIEAKQRRAASLEGAQLDTLFQTIGDDPAVIGVAAGRRGKITGHCEGEPLYHKLAS